MAIKLLNHWLNQALHYYIANGEFCPFFKMYKDKLNGAIAMIEQLDCDAELKAEASKIYEFINNIKPKKSAEIKQKLAETREKSCNRNNN